MKFGDRYIKFMKDRYGIDELYKFLLLICFVLLVINTFVSNNIIRLFEVLLIVIIFYRYMSKNIKLRKKENDKYLEIKDKIIKLFDYNKKKYKDRNTHMYKKCPKCKQKIRLPLRRVNILLSVLIVVIDLMLLVIKMRKLK